MIVTRLAACSLVLSLGQWGCGSSKKTDTDTQTSTATWSNTQMQNLVATRCATSGCHNGSQRPNYSSIAESAMKADTSALSQVNAGKMPNDRAFSASEKSIFVAFYK